MSEGLVPIRLDEIKARLQDKTQAWWVWVTLDVSTKLIPVLEVGASTQAVYERLRDRYAFEERGLFEIKGKGEMPTWLLAGRKEIHE